MNEIKERGIKLNEIKEQGIKMNKIKENEEQKGGMGKGHYQDCVS